VNFPTKLSRYPAAGVTTLPILIGGAPCAGKSTLAKALATERGCEVGHVDDLSDAFKTAKENERHKYPWMFSTYKTTAEEFWENRTPRDLIAVEVAQAKEYWPELKRVMQTGTFGILEGVSILPELVWKEFGAAIRMVVLIDTDLLRVRQTIFTRGIWDDANTYSDWVKEKELEWVELHNAWFREQAKKYPYPLFEVGDRGQLLEQAKTYFAG
jgi:2-phosphoglycerate kinase